VRFAHTQIHISILTWTLQHIENTGYCCGAALATSPAVAARQKADRFCGVIFPSPLLFVFMRDKIRKIQEQTK
jgi:hypothetical protein